MGGYMEIIRIPSERIKAIIGENGRTKHMIEKEYVSLKSDTNFIPVKYAVMDVTVGADIASSYAWIKVVGYGIDTQQHFDDYVTADNMNI